MKYRIQKLEYNASQKNIPNQFLDIQSLKDFKFLTFYYKYLKNIKCIRIFCIQSYFVFVKFYFIVFINILNKKENKYKLIKMQDFALKHKLNKSVLFKKTLTKYLEPYVLSENLENIKNFTAKNFITSEDVYLIKIKDANVIGQSNIVFADQNAIHHDLFNCKLDFTSEELHNIFSIRVNKGEVKIPLNYYNRSYIDEAASFVDAVAKNYAHWTTEVLPRIVAFCKNSKYKNVPLILNDSLHPNMMSSLKRIIGSRNLILLPKNHLIQVKNLYLLSVAGFVSFERRNLKKPESTTGSYNNLAIKLVRKNFLSALTGNKKKWPEKIFIRRNSNYRNLINSKEIEKLLIKKGFSIVELGNQSFVNQAALFYNAKTIIGSYGADFANLIYANPKSNIIMLCSDNEANNYQYWPNISSLIGIKITYIVGKCVEPRIEGRWAMHTDYSINSKFLDESIIRLIE